MGEAEDLIQIVIPCYNGDRYLRETLISIQNQTHKNFDCLLIEDSSTDKSLEIFEDFMKIDSRFRILRNDVNLGESSSVNLGWVMRSSDLITIVNHDDPQPIEWLESIYKFSRRHPGHLFYYPNRRVIDEEGNLMKIEFLDSWSKFKTQKELITIPSVGTLIDAGKFPKDFTPRLDRVRIPSDFAQFYLMSMYGGGKCAPSILANWRKHPSNISSLSANVLSDELIKGTRIILSQFSEEINSLERASLFGQTLLIYKRKLGLRSSLIHTRESFRNHDIRTTGTSLALIFLFTKWTFRKLRRKLGEVRRRYHVPENKILVSHL
jgi:glycosyltransferase involved in cell wall biosynthesis